MTVQEHATVDALTHIGISIRQNAQSGWSWSIHNDKIIRDDSMSYACPAAASGAALEWLLEYARKGVLCHHTHAEPVENDPMAPWERAFEQGIPAA